MYKNKFCGSSLDILFRSVKTKIKSSFLYVERFQKCYHLMIFTVTIDLFILIYFSFFVINDVLM